MGQYYMPALIDEDNHVESLYAHSFDNGTKLTEHSWVGNNFVNAVTTMIYKHPLRVAWIGDYSNEFDDGHPEAYHEGMTLDEFKTYYRAVWADDAKHLEPKDIPPGTDGHVDIDTKGTYLVNHDKRVFLDVAQYVARSIVVDDWCVHPLPLLTACGNNRGGGDFRKSPSNIGFKDVGLWAFDRLEYTDQCPADYQEVFHTFIEG